MFWDTSKIYIKKKCILPLVGALAEQGVQLPSSPSSSACQLEPVSFPMSLESQSIEAANALIFSYVGTKIILRCSKESFL